MDGRCAPLSTIKAMTYWGREAFSLTVVEGRLSVIGLYSMEIQDSRVPWLKLSPTERSNIAANNTTGA